ncbi:hypothetical protein ACFOW4_15420 [Micromonospora sp. GCM10011542]|uniref:hypothetical protein n=1 Tax=Micromonospora sp. GCM10011542 TaxID=3317337 RepID=UPI003607C9F6
MIGSMIALSFGTVFILVNSGGLPDPWPLVVRVVGLLVAGLLVVALVRAARTAPPEARAPVSGFTHRGYWSIVALEAVALFGGLAVINGVLHRSAVSVAWVAVVVGVHFFGLAWIWRMPLFHGLGAAMTVLGLAGFVIYALGGSAAAVGVVAGVGSGIALYAAIAVALRDARRRREGLAY